jgi:hypothetical protein
MSQFFFGKIDLRSSGFSFLIALQQVWLGNFWTRMFSFGIALLSATSIVLFLRGKQISRRSDSPFYTFFAWWIPIIIDLSFLVASKLASTMINRYLLWFALTPVLAILVGFGLKNYERLSSRLLAAFVVFISVFFGLYLRRPTQVLTWRPNLVLEEIAPERFLLFAGVIALIISLSTLNLRHFFSTFQIATAGVWSLFSVPFTTFIVASMDNFHYGEFVGSWFNTHELGLTPYREIEYPRGLLINYIPASFGNFLSGGYPETFSFWFVFLSLTMGIFFAFVMRSFLPLPLVLLLIMILPKANGYNEIDVLMLLTLMKLIDGLVNVKSRRVTSYLIIPISIFWILMVPGQGLILTILMAVAFILNHFAIFKIAHRIRISKTILLNLFVLSIIFFYTYRLLVPAIQWVIRNGRINNQLFGDGWLNQALAPEDFPVSLRFLILIIAPLLFLFTLKHFSGLDRLGQTISVVSLVYLVIVSGRWFGRVDVNTLSRIGMGFLITLLIFILPLLFNFYGGKNVAAYVQAPIFLLIFLFTSALNPFNLNSFVTHQPASIVNDKNYQSMFDRGVTYQRISNLSKELFGPETRMLNLTGGDALNEYLRIPDVGGIHSPYVVTNDAQETDWLDRLKVSNPNFILGGYGSIGSAAFDGSGIGGRAPQVLSWIISNYTISDCGDFIVGIQNKAITGLKDKLAVWGCDTPATPEENLALWNKMDATQSDLGGSLLTWPLPNSQDLKAVTGHGQSVQISMSQLTDRIGIKLSCPVRKDINFTIKSDSPINPLSYAFSAQIESGQYSFIPSIFPISSILHGSFTLNLNDSSCKFLS